MNKLTKRWQAEAREKAEAEAQQIAEAKAQQIETERQAVAREQLTQTLKGDLPMFNNNGTNQREIEILEKHVQAMQAEIEAEHAKTAQQKRAEALDTELGQVSAIVAKYQKEPTRYKVELKAAVERQAAIIHELEAQNPAPGPYQPKVVGRAVFVNQGNYSQR